MVDADPAGKASPPIRPGQLPEVVGIKSEQVVAIMSERVVAITLDQVVAIKSEWVVGSSWNPHSWLPGNRPPSAHCAGGSHPAW